MMDIVLEWGADWLPPAEQKAAIEEAVKIDVALQDFLLLPASVEANPEILSAVEALMERHAKRRPDDVVAWAEQLSENMSRFTD